MDLGFTNSYTMTGLPVSMDGIGDNANQSGFRGGDPGLNFEFTLAPSMDSAFASTVKEACGRKPLPGFGGKHGDKVAAWERCVANFNEQQEKLISQQIETEKVISSTVTGPEASASRTSDSGNLNKTLIWIIAIVMFLGIAGLITYLVMTRKQTS